jgi:hypothetical protein
MQNHEKKQKWKTVKTWDFMGHKINFFFGTLPFSPWAILATWLHVEAPQKTQRYELTTHFEQKFTMGSYGVRIWHALINWCGRKACEACSLLLHFFGLNVLKPQAIIQHITGSCVYKTCTVETSPDYNGNIPSRLWVPRLQTWRRIVATV